MNKPAKAEIIDADEALRQEVWDAIAAVELRREFGDAAFDGEDA